MLNVARLLNFSRASAFVKRRIGDRNVQSELEALRRECQNPQHIDPNERLRRLETFELESVNSQLDGRFGGRSDQPGRRRSHLKHETDRSDAVESSLGGSRAYSGVKKSKGAREAKYDFDVTNEPEYEFESLKRRPKYQDLTHEEIRNVRELKLDARLGDPEDLLNLHRCKVDVRREAKLMTRDDEKLDCEYSQRNKIDELASRLRQRIREQKMEMTQVNKAPVPSFNGVVVDPIRSHVQRRAARIAAMLKENIEQLLICNDPEFLYENLRGANISITRVEMPTSKSTIKCIYTCKFSAGLSDSELQTRLDFISPRMRFWLARKLELGYTPPVKFVRDLGVESLQKVALPPFNLPLETTLKSVARGFDKDRGGF